MGSLGFPAFGLCAPTPADDVFVGVAVGSAGGGCTARLSFKYELSSVRSSATWPGCPAAFAWSAAANFCSTRAAALGSYGTFGGGDFRNTSMTVSIKAARLDQLKIRYASLNLEELGIDAPASSLATRDSGEGAACQAVPNRPLG